MQIHISNSEATTIVLMFLGIGTLLGFLVGGACYWLIRGWARSWVGGNWGALVGFLISVMSLIVFLQFMR
jgi:hypothetical protein